MLSLVLKGPVWCGSLIMGCPPTSSIHVSCSICSRKEGHLGSLFVSLKFVWELPNPQETTSTSSPPQVLNKVWLEGFSCLKTVTVFLDLSVLQTFKVQTQLYFSVIKRLDYILSTLNNQQNFFSTYLRMSVCASLA